MNNDPSTPVTSNFDSTRYDCRFFPSLCWKAIFGGTVAAIGIHLLLTALGISAGLAIFTPITDANPVAHFSVGAAIVWTLCALIGLWFGGLVAGRFSHTVHSGFVHGVLVWSMTLIISLLLLSIGTGLMVGGALKVVGAGLGIGSKAIAPGVADATAEGVKRSSNQIASFTEEAVQSVPTNALPKASVRAKREVGFAVAKLFAPGNDINSPDNRLAAIRSLGEYTDMSEADATKTVDDWITSYKNLKAELDHLQAVAEQKAREAADRTAHKLSCVAAWSFFALLIGLFVAAIGGSCGAKCAVRHANAENATRSIN